MKTCLKALNIIQRMSGTLRRVCFYGQVDSLNNFLFFLQNGAVCFWLTHSYCDDYGDVCTSSCHQQIGNMSH